MKRKSSSFSKSCPFNPSMPDGNKRSYLDVYLNKLLLNAAGCLAKPLEISQNLQEITCARVNFTKKKDSGTSVFQ